MIRAEKASEEYRNQIEKALENSELKPRMINGKLISMKICKGGDSCEK